MVVSALVLGSTLACGTSTSAVKTRAAGFLDEKKEGSTLLERYDLNADGAADLEKVYFTYQNAQKETVKILREKRLDLDYNGGYDMITKYDSDSRKVSEKVDLDFDGKFDAENIYKKGKLSEQRLSPGFDGKLTVWNYFDEKGLLVKKARDTTEDGRADTWEYYAEGKLIRIGYDRDGDGRPEYFEDSEELR